MTDEKASHPVAVDPFPTPTLFGVAWAIVRRIPTGIGSRARIRLLRSAGARVEDGVRMSSGVRVLGPRGLGLGNNVGIARDALLDARAGLELGAGALVGFESILLSWTHNWSDPQVRIADQGFSGSPLVVGERSWIGARAVILPGVRIGEGAVIGAAAVVTSEVPANTVVAGNPAREIRSR